MKVGSLVKLWDNPRRNGKMSGKIGLVVRFDDWSNPVLFIDGKNASYHVTQVELVISENR